MNRALTAAAAGALVVVTAGAALAALGARQASDQQDLARVRVQALAAGRQIAIDLASYDYRTIDRDFTRVSNESTGKFQSDFSTQSAGVRDAIVAEKATSTAQIASAGTVNVSLTSAQVIVALNRTVTNSQAPKGTNSAFGVQLFLVKRGDHWLATQVNPL
jgi:Mce-associated membrane protein